MRLSQFFVATLKEAPSEAEIVSHRLMLRAGLIRRLASGMYTWLPLGLRVLRKVEAVVREEMVRAGAIEVLMPAVQPAELWIESQRWQKYGPELLRFKDRHDREFCFGPTHEEVITDLVRREVKSYRQLPLNFFQIQTKFRDEIRPRFGVMRGREFLMKDAYSFHTNYDSLVATYNSMHDAYSRVFSRLGLRFRAVAADTGSIGGDGSHEFHVLADSGEDDIAFCPNSDYAANVELAEAVAPATPRPAPGRALEKVATPNRKSIAEVAEFLKVPAQATVKSLLLKGVNGPVLLLLRGDHELNEIKAGKLPEIGGDCVFADDATLTASLGCPAGYIGPVGAKLTVIADRAVAVMADFVCGANEAGQHYVGVNFGRDLPEPQVADLRNVVPGDPSPDGQGSLEICRGIEVGHIFQLRKKYSSALNCCFLDENHQTVPMEMGCYGIGVSRIVGACIEQNHDDRGICFPRAMAPFELALVPIGYHRNAGVRAAADKLYSDLQAAGVDVMLDDRDERPGVMFADQELMGIPHRLVVGDRGLAKNEVEYQGRRDTQATTLVLQNVVAEIQSRL